MSNYHLRDRTLALKDKGLLSLMLSLPDDWDYTLKGLSKLSRDGIDAVRSSVQNLERHGYIRRQQQYDRNGRFSDNLYSVYEKPLAEEPLSENPTTENTVTEKPMADHPMPENPTQSNMIEPNKDQQRTHVIQYPSINHSSEAEQYRELLEKNLRLKDLMRDDRYDREAIREIFDLILDVVTSNAEYIRVNQEDREKEVVKAQFLKLRSTHIEYVLNCLQKNAPDIRNIRAYLITTLYNASLTMTNDIRAEVRHDLFG